MKAQTRNILQERADEARRAQRQVREQRDHAARMAGPDKVYAHRDEVRSHNGLRAPFNAPRVVFK